MLKPETELITVAAAGTPIQVSLDAPVAAISIQNPFDAAGYLYVGSLAVDGSTKVGLFRELAPGDVFELGEIVAGQQVHDPTDYWVDAANSTQKALVTVWRHV